MWLLLIFVGLPILEIALFIEVGGWIGLWPTLGIIVLTGVAGIAVMRMQGMQTMERLRRTVAQGGDPADPLAHGALILVAGMLLVLPGFLTDTLGLLLLIPPVRSWLIAWGAARLTLRAATFAQAAGPGRRPAEVIEADYEIVDEPTPPRRSGDSGWTRH